MRKATGVPRRKTAKPAAKRSAVERKPSKKKAKSPLSRAKGKPRKAAVKKARKAAGRKPARRAARKPAPVRRGKPAPPRVEPDEERSADYSVFPPPSDRGLGLEAGGQSGDTEGLSRAEEAASESVEELVEEGQAFEAGIVSGVENADDADVSEVVTRQVPEDDVPQEYLDED